MCLVGIKGCCIRKLQSSDESRSLACSKAGYFMLLVRILCHSSDPNGKVAYGREPSE